MPGHVLPGDRFVGAVADEVEDVFEGRGEFLVDAVAQGEIRIAHPVECRMVAVPQRVAHPLDHRLVRRRQLAKLDEALVEPCQQPASVLSGTLARPCAMSPRASAIRAAISPGAPATPARSPLLSGSRVRLVEEDYPHAAQIGGFLDRAQIGVRHGAIDRHVVLDHRGEMARRLARHALAEREHRCHEEQQGDGDAEDLRADRYAHEAAFTPQGRPVPDRNGYDATCRERPRRQPSACTVRFQRRRRLRSVVSRGASFGLVPVSFAVLRVPVPLEVGDQRRAEMAIRLLARIDRAVAAEEIERLLRRRGRRGGCRWR